MQEDSLIEYKNPGIALPVADALTEVLRRGAGTLLQEAVEAEVAEVIARYQALRDERGRQRVVRNGHQIKKTRSRLALGIFYTKLGMVSEAEGEFQVVVQLNPRSATVVKLLREIQSWKRR